MRPPSDCILPFSSPHERIKLPGICGGATQKSTNISGRFWNALMINSSHGWLSSWWEEAVCWTSDLQKRMNLWSWWSRATFSAVAMWCWSSWSHLKMIKLKKYDHNSGLRKTRLVYSEICLEESNGWWRKEGWGRSCWFLSITSPNITSRQAGIEQKCQMACMNEQDPN